MAKLLHNARLTFIASSAERRLEVSDAIDEFLEIKKRVLWEFEDLEEDGFDTIFQAKLWLDKSRQLRRVREKIISSLSDPDRKKLLDEAKLRLDQRLLFFFRLDIDSLLDGQRVKVVDRGDVIQVRLNLAAFPKHEDRVIEVLKRLLADNS